MFGFSLLFCTFVVHFIFCHPSFRGYTPVPHTGHHCIHDTLTTQDRRSDRGPTLIRTRFKDERYNEHFGVDTDNSGRDTPFSKFRERRAVEQPICLVDGYENIRIHIETQFSGLSSKKRNYLENTILPNARAKISSLLSVIPLDDGWSIPRDPGNECDGTCEVGYTRDCGTADIPSSDLAYHWINNTWEGKNMTNADFVVYFTAKDTESCSSGSTLAYAQNCFNDLNNERPLVGYTNFCPNQIDGGADYFQQINDVAVTIHEIFHALGFSKNDFDKFRDHNNEKWLDKPGGEVLHVFVNERGHDVEKIVTPTALKVARHHFNCPTLNGVEIEDGGGGGTAGSHPEMRVYQTDFMTGVLNANAVFSHITLAVMQDSGWYMANFQNADYLLWGRQRGCDFAMKKCLGSSGMTLAPNTFCTENLQQRCTNDRRSIGICSISEYSNEIESYFQYFDKSNYGGAQEVNDYCPIFNQFTLSGVTPVRTSNCKNPNNMEDDVDLQWYGEEYGVNSACFENNLRNTFLLANPLFDDVVGKCYRYSCSGTDSVTIFLAGGFAGIDTQVVCNKDEAGVKKEGGGPWVGELICPEIESICWEDDENHWWINNETCPNACSGHGTCVPRCSCECVTGYDGDDCSTPVCFGVSYQTDSKSMCSGHGTCAAPDDCQCTGGYSGDDCMNTTCDGASKYDSGVCNGHGTCDKLDTCTCEATYVGQFCHGTTTGCAGGQGRIISPPGACEDVCYDLLASDTGVVCNGGDCVGVDNCDCTPVLPLDGDECDSMVCFGTTDNCGGHGICDSLNHCDCEDGYIGPQCDDFACFGQEFNHSSVCGGHGTCDGPDDCQCDGGWYGVNCNYSTCGGIPGDNATVCSGHGECIAGGVCACSSSYYTESDCGTWKCWGKRNTDSGVCGGLGRGTCVSPNKCECNGKYGGFECEVVSCYPQRCMEGCNYKTGECNFATSLFQVNTFFVGALIIFFLF